VGLVEEIALKNTASKFDIPFIKKTLKGDKELEDIVRERTTVYLEQEFRQLRQSDQNGAKRMVPLIDALISSGLTCTRLVPSAALAHRTLPIRR